jgi:hypothetical protein
MALASDLMGLGVSPLIAARTATGGIGPLTITAAGTTYAASAKIGTAQFLVSASPSSVLSVGLPAIGSDAGAFLADDYIINNQGSATLQVRVSTSVLISMNGSISSVQQLLAHTTATFYPILVSTTAGTANWIGVGGQ